MLSALDRRDRPPEEGAAAGLQGFAVDKTFLSSLKGILLETELALTFIIFICFTASISAYMAAALLEFLITLAFLFLYATQCYQRFDRLNWPCLLSHTGQGRTHILRSALPLIRGPVPAPALPWPPWLAPPWPPPLNLGQLYPRPLAFCPGHSEFTCNPSLDRDFLRCVSAIIIFLVVSFAAVTSRDGAAIAAFVFGIILVSVFAYDAFRIYRTEITPRATQGDQQ
uniref:CKLF like MARVEL transmembrane domain containing 5 n=1 Tax=Molossus molossus TaxID=27622 RepID=A0A7J8JTU7_MOLMO|nr:CKLF like MARVEL transmembrane domain containing 5 [Molossus molossus]